MSKSDRHWYPRYTGDYARKTAHLSLLENGAYVMLMDWYYSNAKPLPAKWVQLHLICKALAPNEQEAVQSVVQEFFTLEADGWHNRRADEEILKKVGISEVRRAAQAQREKLRLSQDAKINSANAGANAPTSTSTSTVKDIASKEACPSPPEINMAFERVFNAYPGRGKDGSTGNGHKGKRKLALERFTKIYKATKAGNHETLIRDIISGAGNYKIHLDRTEGISQHLSTWLHANGWLDDYAITGPIKAERASRSSDGGPSSTQSLFDKVMADKTRQHQP